MKEKILEGAINVFKVKGLKFTMDDLAKEMKMSKKTIYTVFMDKNDLLCNMVDYVFDLIKKEEDEIYYNDSLSLEEKLRGILGVLPDSYNNFDYQTLYQFRDKYPDAYDKLAYRLDVGWEKTIELIKEGQRQGIVRNIDIDIFKISYEATITRLIITNTLEEKGLDYPTAFSHVVDFMIHGLIVKGE